MKKIYILLLLILYSISSFAQQLQGSNWLFGGNGGVNIPGTHLNFTTKNPIGIPFQYDYNFGGGVATISDKNGNLLFFSSMGHISTRIKVNNKYQEMPNGYVFKGSNQNTTAEMITKDPAIDSLYYIFFITNNANGYHDLYVAQVDMRLNNSLGDVVPNSFRLLKKKVAPGMAAMLHSNNRDTWLVTQNAASDSIQAHLINPSGIASPIYSLTNNPRTNPYYSYTRIKGSANSDFIVAKGATERQVKIYDFNRSLGNVSVKHLLTLANPTQGSYSYAFSPDNSKLYVGSFTYLGPPGTSYIYQYDLAAGSTQLVQQTSYAMQIPTNSNFVIDMQVALDGKIYISRLDTVMYLSRINCPNLPGSSSGFQLKAVKILGGDSSLAILPSLNQTVFRNAGILQAQAIKDTICLGDSVQLLAYGAGTERFKWQLANGLKTHSDTLANPFVKPTATTTYTVLGSGACQTTKTATVTVVVGPNPAALKVQGLDLVFPYAKDLVYEISDPALGSVYHWKISGGEISSGQGSSKITVNWFGTPEGMLEVTETSLFHCVGNKATFSVKIDETLKPVFYNIITPNQDEKNDKFVIENLKWYADNELVIYNRWGVEVYRETRYNNNWPTGNVSSGIYYYRFKANGKNWKGWVEVVK